MSNELEQGVSAAIAKMPEWIRRDLASKDSGARQRAEEALTAIIANAMAAVVTP